ncbi:hypothetical protein J6590_070275 [Homalodisca vitripennis]|nr:hypothetical protein J6590_070275 [Homalodisca vitripennis]
MTLNDLQKEHSDYMPVLEKLRHSLTTAVNDCADLNGSFEHTNIECDELEYWCVLEADVKCQKEEMVQLESKARESQESADRCTAAALLMAAYLRHSTPSLHVEYTRISIHIDRPTMALACQYLKPLQFYPLHSCLLLH